MRNPLLTFWCWLHSTWDDRCPCGGHLSLPTTDKALRQCIQCGLVGRTTRLTRRATDEFYTAGYYRAWLNGSSRIPRDAVERGQRRGRLILEYLTAHSIEVKGQAVVEIGCGAGGILVEFREAGATVSGFELDPACVRVARAQGIAVNEATANIPNDIAILSHVLEHTFHPTECLREALSWLQAGGHLYLEYPIFTPHAVVGPHHNWYFSPTAIRVLCHQLGLTPVDTETPGQALLRWGHP